MSLSRVIRLYGSALIPLAALIVGALAGLLAGCGEGERIPVVPVLSTLDMSPDPFVVGLAPRCGSSTQVAAVWLDEQEAVIVGAEGLVLGKSGENPWYPEDSGTDRDLLAAAALADGRVLVVGQDGIVLERFGISWSRGESGTDRTLREITIVADQAWAVGDAGTIVRRLSAGSWEPFHCPTDIDLTGVCLQEDTLYVSGRGGLLLRHVDGEWADLGDGPWGTRDVLSVAAIPGGPTAVLADSLYELRGEKWKGPQGYFQNYTLQGLKAAHGRFWLESSNQVFMLQPEGDVWPFDRYDVQGTPVFIAPGDSTRALIISGQGGIRWYDSDHGYRIDPAGMPGTPILFRLDDGTRGCLTKAGILTLGPAGLVALADFTEETQDIIRYGKAVAGASPMDFYLARSGSLYRIRNGEAELETELPPEMSTRALALDDQGMIYIGSRDGIYTWDGTNLAKVLSGPDTNEVDMVGRGLAGTIMAWGDEGSWYRDSNEWICMTTGNVLFCSETSRGEILSLTRYGSFNSSSDTLRIWSRDVGVLVSRKINLVPGIAALGIIGVAADASGLIVSTAEPSRIFRLAGDPRACRWEPIAGPFDGRINQLMALEDGSLLVFDEIRDHLSLHRFH